jgi:hypothetical protein
VLRRFFRRLVDLERARRTRKLPIINHLKSFFNNFKKMEASGLTSCQCVFLTRDQAPNFRAPESPDRAPDPDLDLGAVSGDRSRAPPRPACFDLLRLHMQLQRVTTAT